MDAAEAVEELHNAGIAQKICFRNDKPVLIGVITKIICSIIIMTNPVYTGRIIFNLDLCSF